MADTGKFYAQGQLAATDGALHTFTASTKNIVTVFLTNTHAGQLTFRLHHTTGGASAAGNALFYDAALQPGQTVIIKGIVADGGNVLRGLASQASKVTYSIYGIERT